MTTPKNILGKKVKALPYDENSKALAGLTLPLVDGAGNITGWGVVATVDQGDGTVALRVDTELVVDNATLNIKNIKVAATDQVGGASEKYLLVDADGTLHVTFDPGVNSNIVKWGGIIQSGADLTLLFQHLDTDLSTRASELTLSSVKTNLDDVKTKLDTLNAKDFATQTTLALIKAKTDNLDVALSTRATETTLSGIKSQTDKLNFDGNSYLNVDIQKINGVLDSGNSSTTPLNASATFTGTWMNSLNFVSNEVFVKTDQNGTLFIDYSIDGITVDRTATFPVTANVDFVISAAPRAQYYRIRFTNTSASNQTSLRLQTISNYVAKTITQVPLSTTLADTNIAASVRAVLVSRTKAGTYVNLKVSKLGSLVTLDEENYALENGNAFISNCTKNSAAAPELVALFVNPVGSGLAIELTQLDLYYDGGATSIWEVYEDPTVTANGTIQSVYNRNIGISGAPSPVGQLYLSPTVSANGNLIYQFLIGATGKVGFPQSHFFIQPGHTLLFRRATTGAGNTIQLNVSWLEEQ